MEAGLYRRETSRRPILKESTLVGSIAITNEPPYLTPRDAVDIARITK